MSDLPGGRIPLEICREIFVRLPGGSLFRFRAVCKTWRTAIDDPSFAWAHTNHHHLSSSSHTTLVIKEESLDPEIDNLYTFDLDAVNLFTDQAVSGSILNLTRHESSSLLPRLPVSVCNGLLLVYPLGLTRLEIWNLSTHERLQLPHVDITCCHEDISSRGPQDFFGLGYDQATQDFKAVVMNRQQAHVYSLRSDEWTTTIIGDFNDDSLRGPYRGVFLCGALHWLRYDNEIIALDVGTGKHRHIQVNALEETLNTTKSIDVLGGCLAVSGFSSVSQCFDVWVMRDYGSDGSWTKLLSIKRNLSDFYSGLSPVAYFRDRNQVLLINDSGSEFLCSTKRVIR